MRRLKDNIVLALVSFVWQISHLCVLFHIRTTIGQLLVQLMQLISNSVLLYYRLRARLSAATAYTVSSTAAEQ